VFFQENRFWPPPCNIRIAGRPAARRLDARFHSSATNLTPSTPENRTVCGVLTALTRSFPAVVSAVASA
jgi:hypothetical protein